MDIKVYKIKDKRPKDGEECWVLHKVAESRSYPVLQVFNDYYNVWDDAEGDDYDFDVNEEDIWMALPSGEEMRKESEYDKV